MDKMLKRDHLKRLAIINNDDVSWGKCKSSRNVVNVALRKVKSAFYASQIENVIGNPRKAWKPLIIFSSADFQQVTCLACFSYKVEGGSSKRPS